jgi:hypothetical protein
VTNRLDLKLDNLSASLVEILVAILMEGLFSIKSEDELLERMLTLGEESRPSLRQVEMRFLSASWPAILAAHSGCPAELAGAALPNTC